MKQKGIYSEEFLTNILESTLREIINKYTSMVNSASNIISPTLTFSKLFQYQLINLSSSHEVKENNLDQRLFELFILCVINSFGVLLESKDREVFNFAIHEILNASETIKNLSIQLLKYSDLFCLTYDNSKGIIEVAISDLPVPAQNVNLLEIPT